MTNAESFSPHDFPVELIGVDCVAPKSCSGCIPGIYIPGVYVYTPSKHLTLVKVGAACCQPLCSLFVIRYGRSKMAQNREPEWKEPRKCACMFQNILK